MEIVTYEIGKKLKEKRYPHDYNDFGRRLIYSDECTIKFINNIGAYEQEYYGENIPCPSISQVLKWLRTDKEIMVFPIYSKNTSRWYCSIVNADSLAIYNFPLSDSYEQAAIVGIEYALDNLI
jgi:hypothetical protein